MPLFAVFRDRKDFRRDLQLDASECISPNGVRHIILKNLKGYK
jgi:hypothetical protein